MPTSGTVVDATATSVNPQDSSKSPGQVWKSHSWYRSDPVHTAEHALRRLRPNIYLPPTAFYATKGIDVQWIIGYQNNDWGAGVGVGYLGLTVPPYYSSYCDELRNTAVIRALNNLKSQKVNLAQAYFERKQTVSLVASSATRIAECFLDLRRGNVAGAARHLGLSKKFWKAGKKGSISDMWLELQYGWKPLLSDVYGAMDELNQKDIVDPGRYYVSVKGSASRRETTTYKHEPLPVGDWMTGWIKSHYGVRVGLDYEQYCPPFSALDRVGITDPKTLAWELLPYSFVADWFIPIGSYLSAQSAGNGYSFKGGYSTAHFEGTFIGSDMGNNYYARSYQSPGSCRFPIKTGSSYRKVVDRRPYGSSPIPRFPGFKNPISLTHLANAISLLSSSVKVR